MTDFRAAAFRTSRRPAIFVARLHKRRLMHFLTMVIGDDPDEQLEPFQDNNFDTCPQAFLEFHDVEDEHRERYLSGVFDGPGVKANDPERYGRPLREVFPTFDDYMDAVHGPRDERTGRYGDWFNPNAQYDWYQLGGRFTGHLILKPGRNGLLGCPGVFRTSPGVGLADQARMRDVDFAAMSRERYARYLATWSELENEGGTTDRRAKRSHNIPGTISTREEFLDYARKRSTVNAPSAVLVNGEWWGPWWATDGLTEVAAFQWDAWYAENLEWFSDDTLLTVIDCHVC